MALDDKSNGVFESVLFKPETTGSEAVFNGGESAPVNDSQIGEEVLFGGNRQAGEELDYAEPQRFDDDRSEVLFDTVKNVREEYVEPVMPVKNDADDSVGAETVFSSGVEELDDIREAKIEEEGFDFIEPVMPDTVDEEVLFGGANDLKAEEEPLTEVDFGSVSSDDLLGDLNAYAPKTAKTYIDKTFAYKMLEADDTLVGFYKSVRDEILKYKYVKSRLSNNYESFNSGRLQLFKIGLAGKTVKLYLNLPLSETEGKMHCKDMSGVKSYAEVPTLLKIRSARSVGYAKTLIEKVANLYSLKLNKKPADTSGIIELLEQYNEKHISK